MTDRRRGMSLIELLVVLTILAVAAGVAGLAMRAERPPTDRDRLDRLVSVTRRYAIRTGRSVTAVVHDSLGLHDIVALPDGTVIADSGLQIDRATGRVRP
ncbi:MAG TPA: prepilin-type N-terminal cleavage/methylation domain-containing protein [Gemmatimonadaceae bacterium]